MPGPLLDRADVAIIGSGFGGSIAAFRYAAAGLRVVVLERGPAIADPDLRQSQAPDDLYRVYTRYQSTFLGGEGGDTGLDVLCGTAVGGGSIVYSGASLRAPSFVFDRLGADGRPLWPTGITRTGLDPHYETVEANLPVTQLQWHTDDPADAWRQVPRRGSVWAKAMGAAGHTVLPLRQAVEGCAHCGWCNTGCRFGAKRDLTKNYLAAAQRLGAVVRAGMEVAQLVRLGDRWQVLGLARTGPGLLDVGPEVTLVDADHVVLAAGTIASTLLLQRSGVANAHLGRHISGNADLPLGAFMAEPTDGYQGVAMDTVSFDFLRPETTGPHASDKFIVISQHMLPLSTLVLGHGGTAAPDGWGLARKHRYRDFGRHFLGLAVIGLDQQEGVLEGPDVLANPGIRLLPLRYRVAPQTQAVWDRAKQVCRDVVEAAGGTFVDLARELANPQTAHPLGGARMAESPEQGVVDADGFVHGVPGLSVLDGAMVPSALGVNPSLTIAALVERAMAKRVTALGRPAAAVLRPADVLSGSVPVAGPTRRSPTTTTTTPPPPPPSTTAGTGGQLPATGGGSSPTGVVGALAAAVLVIAGLIVLLVVLRKRGRSSP
ncbi:MAG: GMC family oxidoreductase, partial [Actinomycetota bacterium]|nr:GMC family oxidoreductase [Actinomycetota bacterium]